VKELSRTTGLVENNRQLHERFRELLGSARAESCQVVSTFLDIRGFSTFTAHGESFDTALYLRSAFSTVLSVHFPDATFFKPTGDGLLIIHELPANAQQVPQIVSSILSRCVSLVATFGQITANDYMINFPVPQQLGVGVARGSVTRLMSDVGVLDYIGRCLNLAARLMDKARPSGVVFADQHARELMDPQLATLFTDDHVCIRGISEQQPMPILISHSVEIPRSDREPIAEADHVWGDERTLSLDEIRKSSSYAFYLPRPPRSYERVGVHVQYPLFGEDGHPKQTVSWLSVRGKYLEQPAGPMVRIDLKRVKEHVQNLPQTTTGKVLGFTHTKTTYVTFTPFCELGALDTP
jgi:class 3 adenylate cyclase